MEFVAGSGRTQALVPLHQDDVRAVDDSDLMLFAPWGSESSRTPTILQDRAAACSTVTEPTI